MSLKAIAEEALARLRAGEMEHETKKETELKQVEQPVSCFTGGSSGFSLMKHGEPQETAENDACFTVSSSRCETDETSLPAALVTGLHKLQRTAPPRITRPEVWSSIVADAVRLATHGWAKRALALGWSALDLWGCSPVRGGNVDQEGLAVKLAGRRLVLLDNRSAVMDSGGGMHVVFNRREMDGAVFLWDLGNRDVR